MTAHVSDGGAGNGVAPSLPGIASTESPPAETASSETVRVLLCDDDAVMGSALSDLVADTPGLELVGMATDADSAATLAAQTRPDVVVLDVRMPGGGGPAAARMVRRAVPSARLIAFSAHLDRRVVLQMLRAGVVEYLVKGVDSDVDILDALRRTGHGHFGLSLVETEELVMDLLGMLEEAERQLRDATRDAEAERDGA